MTEKPTRLGILCGGGPAPGMNSVISAATIEAINSGWEVYGIENGFEDLMRGSLDRVRRLMIEDVSRIHLQGGSILYTSRANPTKKPEDLVRTVEAMQTLGLDVLLTVGGDDTGFSASVVASAASGSIKVVHVPKTIDNDLPLPYGVPTFGYESARHVGANLITNLMTDAMTTRRWFVVVAMGRQAGHLALGIGKSAGATVSVIAEDFPAGEPIGLDHIIDVLETSIFKRASLGRPFGVAVLAEGLSLRLTEQDLKKATPGAELDEHGHVRLQEVHLHRILADQVKARFVARGQKLTVVSKNIGYELRSAPPIPFDVDYTRDLGYGAVDYLRSLLNGERGDEIGAMVSIQDGELMPLRFGTFNDPNTGRPRVRTVNVESESYRVAREYMIRLERKDLDDPKSLADIAAVAQMTPDEFKDRYGYLVEADTFQPVH